MSGRVTLVDRISETAFALFAAAAFLASALDRVVETGAIIREEFAPSRFFFDHGPLFRALSAALLGVAVAAIAAGIVLRRRAGPTRHIPALVLTAGGAMAAVTGSVHGLAIALPALAVHHLLSRADALRSGGGDGPRFLPAPPAAGRLVAAAEAILLPFLAFLVASILEVLFHTRPIAADLVRPGELTRLLLLQPLLAAVAPLVVVAAFATLALIVADAGRRRPDPGVFPLFIATATGAVAAALVLTIVTWSLADELAAVGLLVHAVVLAEFAGLVIAASVAANLRWLAPGPGPAAAALPPREVLRLVALSATAPLLAPLLAVARPLRGPGLARAIAIGMGAALTILLSTGCYPALQDYGIVATQVFALLCAALLATLLFAVLKTPLLRGRRAAAIVLSVWAALVLGSAVLLRSEALPPVLHEHTAIGRAFLRATPVAWLLGGRPLGEGPVRPEDAGVVAPPEASRLPEVAGLPVPERLPPIVLVVIDGARVDRTGHGGYRKGTTPRLDAFAATAATFTACRSQGTATSLGMRHVLTGRYSSRTMLIPDHDPFLTKDLLEIGYRRFLITAFGSDYNGLSDEAFFRNHGGAAALPRETVFIRERSALTRVDRVLRGLAEGAEGTLAILYFTETHFPWTRDPAVGDFGPGPEGLYDNAMAQADRALGRLLDGLVTQPGCGNAVIAVLADHGTGLGDHGRVGGFLPLEEQLRTVFVLKVPGVPPRTFQDPVAHIDLAPTVVNLFRRGAASRFHGVSLLPLMTGEAPLPRRHLFALAAFEDACAVIAPSGLKLHAHRALGTMRLYDLATDPGERRDLLDARRDEAEDLVGLLDAFLRAGRDSWARPRHYARP